MQNGSVLSKGSKNGFTVIPNSLVDALLGKEHTSDALALAVYLLRHVAGQAGAIEATSDFSQTAMCLDLGWGKTNRERLKRSRSMLEDAGMLKTELRQNNTLVLHVSAPVAVVKAAAPAEAAPPPSPPMDFAPLPKSLQRVGQKTGGLAPARLESLVNKNNIKNHLREGAREKHDDELEEIFLAYRSKLEKPLATRNRETFAAEYEANGRPRELVLKAIATLGAHPKLWRDTTSINAVWELAWMERNARSFDQAARQAIAAVVDSHEGTTSPHEAVQEFARGQKLCPERFIGFFATDIEAAIARRERFRRDSAAYSETEVESTTAPTSIVEETAPDMSDVPVSAATAEEELVAEATVPLSVGVEKDPGAAVEETVTRASRAPTCLEEKGDASSETCRGVDALPEPEKRPQSPPPPRLETRDDVRRLIFEALAKETRPEVRQRLESLAGLVEHPRLDFLQLRALALRHAA